MTEGERQEDGPLTLTTLEALAKFGEPRYSITDLQRAWAEGGAAAILAAPERQENGWEELRREIEALLEPDGDYGLAGAGHTAHNVAIRAVLAIIDRLAAVRQEPAIDVERLAKALSTEMDKGLTWFYMGHVQGDLTLDDWRNCAEAIAAEYALRGSE